WEKRRRGCRSPTAAAAGLLPPPPPATRALPRACLHLLQCVELFAEPAFALLGSGVEAHPASQQVRAQDGETDGDTGDGHQPPPHGEVVLSLADDQAPGRLRRLGAAAKEHPPPPRQRGLA